MAGEQAGAMEGPTGREGGGGGVGGERKRDALVGEREGIVGRNLEGGRRGRKENAREGGRRELGREEEGKKGGRRERERVGRSEGCGGDTEGGWKIDGWRT